VLKITDILKRWQKSKDDLAIGSCRLDFNVPEAEDSAQNSKLTGYVLNLIQPDTHDSFANNSSFFNQPEVGQVIICAKPIK